MYGLVRQQNRGTLGGERPDRFVRSSPSAWTPSPELLVELFELRDGWEAEGMSPTATP